jgi:aldehyde:ferredoxin oxidoreductase
MGGWTGKVLRVDLTTGAITKEDTTKYKPFLGGTGLGYKVLWDEVPPGTKAWDPANRLIFGVGPLTGTGAPLSGRTSVTSLWPMHPEELPATGHMGGHWGPELKYAGYDSLIIQGKAASPVWIYIKDDVVEIRDAGRMWGNGIYRATSDIMNIMGPEAHVAAIGQCGENLVRGSNVMCDRSHSAGGVGSVMGSKKLKAIGVIGTGSLKIEATKTAWKDLVHYQHTILGANSGGVVPNTFQAWQPDGYYGGTRWTAANGLYWGAATPPVHTGDCTADDLNSIGIRTFKGYADFGPGVGDKHTVKIGGCHSCPIRCHIATDVPALEQFGVSRYQVNTCNGNSTGSGFTIGITSRSENAITSSQLGVALCDDYGWWSDYGLAQADFKWLAQHILTAAECTAAGLPASAVGRTPLHARLSDAEWTRVAGPAPPPPPRRGVAGGAGPATPTTPPTWFPSQTPHATSMMGKFLASDFTGKMNFIQWLIPDIKNNLMDDRKTPATYELMVAGQDPVTGKGNATLGAYIGVGSGRLEKLWPELAIQHQKNEATPSVINYIKMGHIKHHFTETTTVVQPAALLNMMYNRDPMCHTHTNYEGNGLPVPLQNEIFNELFGPFTGGDALDETLAPGTLLPSPMNQAKAVFAKMSILYMELHNSLTLCNYTLPGWASPLKSRNYRGARDMEALMYSAVTGDTVTAQQLEDTGLRILTLFRALTARYMNEKEMRNKHDMLPEYSFHAHSGAGTLDHADWEVAKSMFYAVLGWDETTGLPTQATYNRLGLGDVAAVMAASGLMP